MPSARSRRRASTVNDATATRPTKISPSVAAASTMNAGLDAAGGRGCLDGRAGREAERGDIGRRCVEQDRHLGRGTGLPGGDECELVGQVARVLHDAHYAAGLVALAPDAAGMGVVEGCHLAGQRDLAGPVRVMPGDQGQRRLPVGAGRILRTELDLARRAGDKVLILDHIDRAEPVPDRCDIGGQPRLAAGDHGEVVGGPERGRSRGWRGVAGDRRAGDRSRDGDGDQREHQQLLAPLAAEQPPRPADHRPPGRGAAAGTSRPSRGRALVHGRCHRFPPGSSRGPRPRPGPA